MRQQQLFTRSELSAMRDRTRGRNYSPERDNFRRDHERRRYWGLKRRHAERLRQLRGGAVDGSLAQSHHDLPAGHEAGRRHSHQLLPYAPTAEPTPTPAPAPASAATPAPTSAPSPAPDSPSSPAPARALVPARAPVLGPVPVSAPSPASAWAPARVPVRASTPTPVLGACTCLCSCSGKLPLSHFALANTGTPTCTPADPAATARASSRRQSTSGCRPTADPAHRPGKRLMPATPRSTTGRRPVFVRPGRRPGDQGPRAWPHHQRPCSGSGRCQRPTQPRSPRSGHQLRRGRRRLGWPSCDL